MITTPVKPEIPTPKALTISSSPEDNLDPKVSPNPKSKKSLKSDKSPKISQIEELQNAILCRKAYDRPPKKFSKKLAKKHSKTSFKTSTYKKHQHEQSLIKNTYQKSLVEKAQQMLQNDFA